MMTIFGAIHSEHSNMAFTFENINDMENIVKATGLSEGELADLILAKENEGWTNAEIADLLASNFDNKEYASKAQDELDAMYSLGFNPPKDYNPTGGKRYQQWQEYKEDPSLFDRFKSWYAANKDADEQRNAAAREAIAKSVNDWRDSHPEQWRVGMVNAMFGDNSLLSQYYSAKHAAEEGEKNRAAQREYNQYLKDYDRAKEAAEKSAAYKKELKEAEVELASLDRDLIKARPTEAAVIRKRKEALFSKYPDLKKDESVEQAYEDEQKYKRAKIAAQRALPTTFATDQEIDKAIAAIADNAELLDEDKEEMIKDLQSKKSTATLAKEASQSAVASHAGKKTGQSLDDADLTAQTLEKIKSGKGPSTMSAEQRSKARELGYNWNGTKWE